jgi:hypothetical protein
MTALDPAVAATLARALALPSPAPETTRFPQAQFPGLRVTLTPAVDDTQAQLLAEVFAAVQWPTQIPLPHQLTPAQREVALGLCDVVVDVGEDNATIPASRVVRRRWLGLDPPTALERKSGVLPLWALLAEGRPLPASLTLAERVQLAHDVLLGAYGLSGREHDVTAGLSAAIATAKDATLAAWARDAALALVSLFAAPDRYVERGRSDAPPDALARLLTHAIAAGGGVIDGDVRGLVRFAPGGVDDAIAVIAAVPAAERGRAIADAAAPLFANDRIELLLGLVARFVSDPVVDAIFHTFNDPELTRPRAPLYARLREAITDPSFAPYVARRLDALPKPRMLRCRPSTTPAHSSGLTPLQRAQVAVGANGIQGCGTDWINDEEIEALELFAIEDDAGVHRYDAAILMGEDGVFFLAGHTTPIAWLCQFRLDCDDVALKDGLAMALAARRSAS